MPQILIIEDSPDTQTILEAVLNKAGFEILLASSARQGFQLLQQKKIKPDAILLDIQLPDQSGYDVCEELQAHEEWGLIPVVFLTADEQRESKLRAFQLGAVGFLTKPVQSDALLEQVRKALSTRKQWLDSFGPDEPGPVPDKNEAKLKPATRTQPLEEKLAELSHESKSLQVVQKQQALSTRPVTQPLPESPVAQRLPEVSEKPLQRAYTTGQLPGQLVPLAPEPAQILESTGNFAGLVLFLIDKTGREPEASISPETLYDHALSMGLSTAEMAKLVSDYTGLPLLTHIEYEQVRSGLLPLPFCRKYHVVPLSWMNQVVFALPHPYILEVNDVLRRHQGQKVIADPALILSLFEGSELRKKSQTNNLTLPTLPKAKPDMADLIDQLHSRYGHTVDEINFDNEDDLSLDVTSSQNAPMVKLVNQIIEEAYQMRASDIHIEPWEEAVVVRFRIDGELRDIHALHPAKLILPLVARIKIMAELNMAERRLPQDGRIVFKKYNRKGIDVDLRVATAPMNFGEKVVMRLIDKQKSTLPLEALGMSKRNLEAYRTLIHSPYGMVLHVGPTGSGKSMTLYSALNEINRPELNIQTVEDPIEYTLPRINQLQVQSEIGLTFARALRAYLRQDPDIILVGEIRDRETAQIAIEASLTGHLLLSTLHTNDSPATLTRFLEMGIEPFMISPAIVMICAQRLMKRLCPSCKQPYSASESERVQLGLPAHFHLTLYRPNGCQDCNGEGFKGRIGIHELLIPTEAIRSALTEPGMTSDKLKRIAVEEGMTTLFWDAMEKVRMGITTIPEALARVQPDTFDSRPKWMRDEFGA